MVNHSLTQSSCTFLRLVLVPDGTREDRHIMKKLLGLMLGLAVISGSVAVGYAQDDSGKGKAKAKGKKKGGKKKNKKADQ